MDNYQLERNKEAGRTAGAIVAGFFVLILMTLLYMVGCPQYNVYSQRMDGEAQLAHSEYSKKVQVQDALGKLEAAKSLAAADIERAKGVAAANQIIADSLKGNEVYLHWLFIEGLKEKTGQEVIYVPTEAGIPIMEAGRRSKRAEEKK